MHLSPLFSIFLFFRGTNHYNKVYARARMFRGQILISLRSNDCSHKSQNHTKMWVHSN